MNRVYDLINKVHQGDKEAREQFIIDNMGLVVSVVRRFPYTGMDMEEMIQIGCIGLMKAIDHFDTSYEVCFSTYAVPMILRELKRYVRDDGPMKVSRSIIDNQRRIHYAKQEYEQKHGEAPTLQQIQEITGLEIEDILLADGINRPVESIYQTVYESEGSELQLLDSIPAKGLAIDESTINGVVIQEAMDCLEPQERQIIQERYFEDVTQVRLAEKLDMTQVQVSRTEKKALRKMRQIIAEQ